MMNRDEWIEWAYKRFVHPSKKNREYYRLILEALWPKGHSIPGPVVKKTELDRIVERYRGQRYLDLARRIRELQGEEGVIGLIRIGSGSGTAYQLQNLKLAPKRIPRTGLDKKDWQVVLKKYNYSCANCGRTQKEMRLDEDHKIPRIRGGSDELENWQPLCKECNNFKSTSCRNCKLDCYKCPWAFPDKYKQIKISPENLERILSLAKKKGIDPMDMVNEILDRELRLQEK